MVEPHHVLEGGGRAQLVAGQDVEEEAVEVHRMRVDKLALIDEDNLHDLVGSIGEERRDFKT